MKLSLLFLSLAGTASAFVTAPARVVTTSLSAAATGDDFNKKPNDWTGYPLTEKKSTAPVASRKVTPAQRAKMADVMIDPNYFITFAVAALGPLIMWYHPCKLTPVSVLPRENDRKCLPTVDQNPFTNSAFVIPLSS